MYHSPSRGIQTGLTPVEAVMMLSEDSFLHSHATRVILQRRFQEIIEIASAHRHRNAATAGVTE